jgi:hypothetical protein
MDSSLGQILSVESQRVLLEVDFDRQEIKGFTRIDIIARNIQQLNVHVGNLNIEQISINDKHCLDFKAIDKFQWIEEFIGNIGIGRTEGLFEICQDRICEYISKGNLQIPFRSDEESIKLEIHFQCSNKFFREKNIDGTNHQYFIAINRPEDVVFPSLNGNFGRIKSFRTAILVPLMYPIEMNGRTIEFQALGPGKLIKNLIDAGNDQRIFLFEQDEIPVSSMDLGIVLGYLDTIVYPNNSTLVQFCCYPGKYSKLSLISEFCSRSLDFYNSTITSGPHLPTFSLIFMDEEPVNCQGLSICNSGLLYDKTHIDQTYITKLIVCQTISLQYFYFRVEPSEISDVWLFIGLSRYMADLCLKRLLGINEVQLRLKREMDLVCILDVDKPPIYHPWRIVDEAFSDLVKYKSTLVMHMIESKVGRTSMIKVLNSVYSFVEGDKLSTTQFLKLIKRISVKDPKEFVEQWIYRPGIPHFVCSFLFNRKKTVIEVTIRQSMRHDGKLFVGPLKIRVNEFEGTYDHSVHIEEAVHQIELSCHVKHKRPRIKNKDEEKGESNVESSGIGSAVAWIRVDPDLEWIRIVEVQQPDFMWIEQLYRDKLRLSN